MVIERSEPKERSRLIPRFVAHSTDSLCNSFIHCGNKPPDGNSRTGLVHLKRRDYEFKRTFDSLYQEVRRSQRSHQHQMVEISSYFGTQSSDNCERAGAAECEAPISWRGLKNNPESLSLLDVIKAPFQTSSSKWRSKHKKHHRPALNVVGNAFSSLQCAVDTIYWMQRVENQRQQGLRQDVYRSEIGISKSWKVCLDPNINHND